MNTVCWPSFLLELLVKSALILLSGGLLAQLAAHASAARRHALWLGLFGALLGLPLTKLVAPRWSLAPEAATLIARAEPASPVQAQPAAPATGTTMTPSHATWSWPAHSLWLGVWVAGALAVLGYRLLGSWQLIRLRRSSTPIPNRRIDNLAAEAAHAIGLRRPASIWRSESALVPCTWGTWRPCILLPAEAESWDDDHLRATLRHEFAHIARRDYLARWVALLGCALYWPNPLVWIAARRLRATQEQACDDQVLAAGTPPADYAALLLATARALCGRGSPCRAAVAMARPATLEGRVLAIVDPARDRRLAGRFVSLASVSLAVGIVTVSALAQVAPKPPEVPRYEVDSSSILIDFTVIELPKGKAPLKAGAILDVPAEAEAMRKLEEGNEAALLARPRIVTHSGRRTELQTGNDLNSAVPPEKLPAFTLRVEATPQLAGGKIVLAAKVTMKTLSKDPAQDNQTREQAQSAEASPTLNDGETVVLPALEAAHPGREILVLLKARLAKPGDLSLVPGKGEEAGRGAPALGAALGRAATLILPQVALREATLVEAVDDLRAQARAVDPEKKGVEIILAAGFPADGPKLTLQLAQVPLSEAIRYVAALGGGQVRADAATIVIEPMAAPALPRTP